MVVGEGDRDERRFKKDRSTRARGDGSSCCCGGCCWCDCWRWW